MKMCKEYKEFIEDTLNDAAIEELIERDSFCDDDEENDFDAEWIREAEEYLAALRTVLETIPYGEEWENAFGEYSDLYKDINGIRPRWYLGELVTRRGFEALREAHFEEEMRKLKAYLKERREEE